MTRQRDDDHSTEFGIWLREQPALDSKLGYIATNIDYLWKNYKTGKWMLLEEKRYLGKFHYAQRETFKWLYKLLESLGNLLPGYEGFHSIVFENTNPDDGKIYLDKKSITKQELIEFLSFKNMNRY